MSIPDEAFVSSDVRCVNVDDDEISSVSVSVNFKTLPLKLINKNTDTIIIDHLKNGFKPPLVTNKPIIDPNTIASKICGRTMKINNAPIAVGTMRRLILLKPKANKPMANVIILPFPKDEVQK